MNGAKKRSFHPRINRAKSKVFSSGYSKLQVLLDVRRIFCKRGLLLPHLGFNLVSGFLLFRRKLFTSRLPARFVLTAFVFSVYHHSFLPIDQPKNPPRPLSLSLSRQLARTLYRTHVLRFSFPDLAQGELRGGGGLLSPKSSNIRH